MQKTNCMYFSVTTLFFDKNFFSDRQPIETRIEFDSIKAAHEMPSVKYAFKKVNEWEKLNEIIEIEPFMPYCFSNVDELVRPYYKLVWEKIDKIIPRVNKQIKVNTMDIELHLQSNKMTRNPKKCNKSSLCKLIKQKLEKQVKK